LAFQVPTNEHASAVRVNLRGREPKGRIAPGAEYQAFCEILTADLLDLVNLDTGKPAVRAVLQTDREYPGERLDDLPDLLVIWNREAPIEGLGSSKVGEVRGVLPGFRTGDHTREAILIARGPGIESGQSTTAISLVDIAPTVAAAVGVSLNDVDGRPAPKLAGLMPVSQAV
jgi:predicted AlkP superfamily phosphohydrolase/phosphomutase